MCTADLWECRCKQRGPQCRSCKRVSIETLEFVFFLDADGEFLEERVLNLPESVVQGTSHSVEKYFPRLASFRKNNSVDKTVIKYFLELGIHSKRIGKHQKKALSSPVLITSAHVLHERRPLSFVVQR